VYSALWKKVPRLNLMPRLRKARSSSFELFSSSTGTRCGRPSTMVTSVPKDFHAEANSTPITPPPSTIAVFGTRSRVSAWSEEMIRSPSMVSPGSERGTEPVASTTWRPWIRCPFTSTEVGDDSRPSPSMYVTLREATRPCRPL